MSSSSRYEPIDRRPFGRYPDLVSIIGLGGDVTLSRSPQTTIVNPRVTLATGGTSVFADGGTALVVHAKADDMKTNPAGDAGERIACGLIAK